MGELLREAARMNAREVLVSRNDGNWDMALSMVPQQLQALESPL
jgi:hypothetical protein